MFREWGFLLTEMIGLIFLAALLGLFVGWLIWGRRSTVSTGDSKELRDELESCRTGHAQKDAKLRELRAQLETCETDLVAAKHFAENTPAPVASPVAAPAPVADLGDKDYDGDGVIEGKDEGSKPETLTAARGGKADDLKQIKGIGPKLEKLCNKLGFYHFDQIAAWSADEIAWVDANLEGFKGRVSRDTWVDQAKTLAAGGQTEFSSRVKKGDVY